MRCQQAMAPTRPVQPTRRDPVRNGEPYGELGLVLPEGLRLAGPDRRAGRPAGRQHPRRRARRAASATFNDGTPQASAPDSGHWSVEQGPSTGRSRSDSAATRSRLLRRRLLPSYFEILATINAAKPPAGWKANAFVIFDYRPDRLQVRRRQRLDQQDGDGHRTADGWIVDVQGPIRARSSPTDYNLLLALNGTLSP